LAQPAQLERKVFKELPVQLVQQERKELLATTDLLALKAFKVNKEFKALPVLQEARVLLELLARPVKLERPLR
jgi:hypothetical protein